MQELIQKIEQWAEDRNIIKGSTPIDQAMKLFSEFGELSDHVGDNELSKIPDDVGDIFVVLTIISKQFGKSIEVPNELHADHQTLKSNVLWLGFSLTDTFTDTWSFHDNFDPSDSIHILNKIAELIGTDLESCVKLAYEDIKDRKGVLIDGVFIKESNPAYAKAIKSLEENFSVEDSK